MITDTMNPFSEDIVQEHISNIASGKAASQDTTSFLLGISLMGNQERENFIQESVADPSRFERSIPRQKLKVSEGKKSR